MSKEKLVIALDSKNGKVVVNVVVFVYICGQGSMMQGTDLEWFAQLRAATTREITAARGITTLDNTEALKSMDIHATVGMAIYTGRLSLGELRRLT